MPTTAPTMVNAGARLDRLPISSFHRRIFWLIGAGMFFDGYDLYVGTTVLPAMLQSKFSTLPLNAQFVSLTFLGMTIGAFISGFLGDKFGRRFTYQANLLIFGLASLAATFAPDMTTLNALRFVMGLGLGAEIVVGYSTLTEFVPPASRGRWLAFMAFVVVAGLPVSTLIGNLLIPQFGWQPMFAIAGVGALIVWWMRKSMPESPRWLEANGRTAETEALMQSIEREVAGSGTLPPVPPVSATPAPIVGFGDLLRPPLLSRMIVGSICLITVNTLIFGFVTWLPQFFFSQGLTLTRSLAYTMVMAMGSVLGCAIGAFGADFIGRRMSIIGAALLTIAFGAAFGTFGPQTDPTLFLAIGFLLIVSIYIQVAILFGVYTPELFPTEVRLRANGICNTLGRAATIVSPFAVLWLFQNYRVPGVLAMMLGLLLLQILVIGVWGVEPRNRRLEEVAGA